ncbi:MAG: retroviral-like aspartic protease family protein, partial [Abditibacteriales bacterium]|nr:retroviral-like aspartic protease family protein [Abditibacteriales bacterium]MDW8366269.1 retropepsin-like aspartic protease [Abditibacteriales bacterium]
MRRVLFLDVLGLLCLLSTSSVAAEAPSVIVPMEVLRTKHITVQVKVNDVGPFRLVFDTGAPYSFISGRAAAKIGLITAEQAQQPSLFGMRGQKTVNSFSVGDVRVRGLSLMILDHPLLELLSDVEGPIDGIVGFNFFARFRTTIEYATSQLTLTPVDYQPPEVLSHLMA